MINFYNERGTGVNQKHSLPHLINEKPGHEEETDSEEHDGQLGEDGRIHLKRGA